MKTTACPCLEGFGFDVRVVAVVNLLGYLYPETRNYLDALYGLAIRIPHEGSNNREYWIGLSGIP